MTNDPAGFALDILVFVVIFIVFFRPQRRD